LNVALPLNYSPSDTGHYPVFYVLDGKYNFTSFSSVRDILDLGREVKDIIIVGIDGDDTTQSGWLANRFNDFTPSDFLEREEYGIYGISNRVTGDISGCLPGLPSGRTSRNHGRPVQSSNGSL
jgi:enterochelin esterase-like enzyme